MLTKIVAKKKDGTLIKGMTGDFLPDKNSFHLNISPTDVIEINMSELKAIFFVKKLEGDRLLHDSRMNINNLPQHAAGKHIMVTFHDGEIIKGFSHSLHMDRLGFLMVPIDKESNNERIFVVFSFVKNILVDGRPITLPNTTMNPKDGFF